MSDQTRQQLQQAYQLIKEKKRVEARAILQSVLQQYHTNHNAWWLMANAASDPNEARQALEQVLSLKPDHDNAQKMLTKINERYPPPPPQPQPADDPFALPDDDPFAESAAGFGAAAPAASDPFSASGDPFGAPDGSPAQADPFGAPDNPFGSPAQSFGGPASSDPFGSAPAAGAPTPKAKPASGQMFGPQEVRALLYAVAAGGIVLVLGLILGLVTNSFGNNIANNIANEFETNFGFNASGANVQQRGGINVGDSRSDFLASGDAHYYTMNVTGGQTVTFDLTGDFDTYIEILDGSGNQVTFDDDGGDGLNSFLTHTFSGGGTYTVVVRSFSNFDSGNYQLVTQ